MNWVRQSLQSLLSKVTIKSHTFKSSFSIIRKDSLKHMLEGLFKSLLCFRISIKGPWLISKGSGRPTMVVKIKSFERDRDVSSQTKNRTNRECSTLIMPSYI